MSKNIVEIKIDDYYTLVAEPDQWILQFVKYGKKNPKTGKPMKYTRTTYHSKLEHALRTYCDQNMKEKKSMEQIIELIKGMHKKIEELTDELEDIRWKKKI